MKKLFIIAVVALIFIGITTISSHAQSFNDFVAQVNTTTGITTNDYQSNLKKAEMLGMPNNTLWELYTTGTKVLAHNTVSTATIPTNTVEEVITPQSVKIDALATIDSISVSTTTQTPIATLNTPIKVQSLTLLQEGDVIIASKGYKSFIVAGKPQVKLSASKFDLLYDTGLIKPKSNRRWVFTGVKLYNDDYTNVSKSGLGDGFLSIIFIVVMLLVIAKQVGTPKQDNTLVDQIAELKNTNKKLAQEVQDKSGEVKTLKDTVAKQQATINSLSRPK